MALLGQQSRASGMLEDLSDTFTRLCGTLKVIARTNLLLDFLALSSYNISHCPGKAKAPANVLIVLPGS